MRETARSLKDRVHSLLRPMTKGIAGSGFRMRKGLAKVFEKILKIVSKE